MEDAIIRILQSLLPSNDAVLYGVLFISAVIENLFPPIPGDTITAFGAFLVGTGRLNYFLAYASTTLGSVVGFTMLFLVGRFIGREYFINKDYWHLPARRIIAAEEWFKRYGHFVILANRFLPGIRSVISLVSGISALSTPRVFMYALASSALWNLIWIHTGYVLGSRWEVVKSRMGQMLHNYNIALAILIALALFVFFVYYEYRKHHSRRGR